MTGALRASSVFVNQGIPMRKQWRCFHCDEVFRSVSAATIHFGGGSFEDAGCVLKDSEVGLLGIIREQQADLERFRAEDSDLMRDPTISPEVDDIVRATIYKNGRMRHVTGVRDDYVTYMAVSPTKTKVTGCDLRSWQRWCAYTKVEIVQRGREPQLLKGLKDGEGKQNAQAHSSHAAGRGRTGG
jgi:hypothetical protein